MPKRIAIVNHVSTEELLVRYRQATEATIGNNIQLLYAPYPTVVS
ncbi:hypothetical protein [Nostoc sp. 'Peltigera membranacea cyanobiont' 210A]|nr:hypothetical protein [Nostoc sp. 'Peltigera membranacea cyanobiont' 210A]